MNNDPRKLLRTLFDTMEEGDILDILIDEFGFTREEAKDWVDE